MTRGPATEGRLKRFEALYTVRYPQVAGYVRRRVAADAADDVTARVFAVAWRRFDRVPPPPEDRLWLFGVARNCVAEQERSEHRRLRLHARLARDAATELAGPAAPDSGHERVRAAIDALRPPEQEALRLVLWEELSHSEAAAVLGCTVNAFELRYRRARNRVRDALSGALASPQPTGRAGQAPLVRKPTTSRTYPS
jgi:RNA polymerase sigma-70 factor (ECF subfamily)